MKKGLLIVLVGLLLPVLPVLAQNPGQAEITPQEIYDHIAFLASDSLKGRKTGTQESHIAAAYIRDQVRALGLTLLGDNGFQYFNVVTSVKAGPNNRFAFEGFAGKAGEDFTPISFSASATLAEPVVFAGYGFEFSSDSLSWHDYAGIDATGKWVMLLLGDPEPDNPMSAFADYSDLRKKVLVAKDHGAGGVLFVAGPDFDKTDALIDMTYDRSAADVGVPVLQIKRAAADSLLRGSGHSIAALEKQLNESKTPASFATGKDVTASADVIKVEVTTQNVVAVLPGSDPVLKDEYIAVGAHYDHLGFGGPGSGSRRPDTLAIHNGADDNASGVAGILELIEELAANRQNLQRSILFLSFAAEEMGLLGSGYFVEHPLVELQKIKMMFNLDMVGHLDAETQALEIGGTGTAKGLEEMVQQHVKNTNLQAKLSPAGFGPSDHASFYAKDIPVLFFFTGSHEAYHTPDDDVQLINTGGEKNIADLAYGLIVEVANAPTAPVFQEAGPKTRSRGRRRFKVTLGIMPDHTAVGITGLRVQMVIPDRPAALAGMEKGDVIVAMDGKPVEDIYSYMHRLSELKPGQRIAIEVLRDGKKIILTADL